MLVESGFRLYAQNHRAEIDVNITDADEILSFAQQLENLKWGVRFYVLEDFRSELIYQSPAEKWPKHKKRRKP